ncbi:anion transporter, partial [Acidobacteria bacterium AH-259-D05]|nr:anion transporter [Acidobacteria bacterium AH-259-D05]
MAEQEKVSRVPKLVKLAAGPITFLAVYLLPLEGLSYEGQVVLATLGWAAAWWLLEPIPWAITALIPLVIFPVLGVMSIRRATALYGQNLFFWLLGLLMFGY